MGTVSVHRHHLIMLVVLQRRVHARLA